MTALDLAPAVTDRWDPRKLSSLRAWYDAEYGQPRYGGAGAYVQLDGIIGDYIYTPDSAATSFNNDIEVVMRVKVTDWSAAAIQTLVGKYLTTGNQRSWRFYTNTAGNIGLTASADGTSVTTVTVTPTNPLPDDTWIWIRPRLDLTNGANSVGTIDTAADTGSNALVPISWTANGSATGATIAGVFDGTGSTEIGSFTNGTAERLAGQVGRCIVRAGFDGTTVADFNASDCYGDGYWHADGYRWNLGLPKIYDRGPGGLAPATFGSGSNQPKWLPWTGRSQVYLPGAAGNYVSTPDAAALDVAGDLELLVVAAADDWTPGAAQFICGKWGSGGEWAIVLGTSTVEFWGDGNGSLFFLSGANPGLLDGLGYWFRASRDAATGSVALEYAPWSVDEPASWTSIASGASAAGPTTAGPNAVAIGADSFGTNPFGGKIERFIIRDDGTTVADFVAASCGQSGYTDTLGNVWTVNRSTSGRKIVVQSPVANSARSLWLYGTDDQASAVAAAAPALGTTDAATFGVVGRNHADRQSFARHLSVAAGATEAIQLGEITTGNNSYYYLSDGTNIAQGGGPALPQTVRAVRTLRIDGRGAGKLVDTVNANAAVTADTSAVGAVTATAIRLGASATSGGNADDGEIEAMFTLDRAISDTEHGQLVAYYRGGL